VQTTGKSTTPIAALKLAIEDVRAEFEHISLEFSEKVRELNEEA